VEHDLFISYATTDGLVLAREVSEFLTRKYLLSVYLADEQKRSGEVIDAKVKEAINSSRKVLLLFTPDATRSHWVQGEASFALELKKTLIICRRKDVEKNFLPLQLMDKEHTVFADSQTLVEFLDKEMRWGIPLIIPCAGKSGGLYPMNLGMPKVLLPIGDRPILHHIIQKLDPRVFSQVIILTDKFSEMIEYFANLARADIPIRCLRTSHPRLPMALKEMGLETPFMIHYSDIIIEGDFDWKDFIEHHKNHKQRNAVIGTLMASNRYQMAVGRIRTGGQQIIKEFTEKPESLESVGYSINMAVSIFEPDFLTYVEDGDQSLYGHTVRRAMAQKKKFCLYGHDNWRHIQTLSDWYEAQAEYVPGDEDSFSEEVTSPN
jgi:choline kinase